MEMLCLLNRHANRVQARSGESIISEGGSGGSIFFMISGMARVVKNLGSHEETLQELLPGHFFGRPALIMDRPYLASVVAVEDCDLCELGSESFSGIMQSNPAMLMEILCASSNWLLEVDRKLIEKLQKQNEEGDILLMTKDQPASNRSLAARVVHNLNNPLASIYSVAQLLTLEHPDMEEAQRIIVQCRIMMDMIRGLTHKSGMEGSEGA